MTNSPFMSTYHRLPLTFTRGEGAWLWDTAGKKYLDWTSGIAVNCLGHNYPPLVRALREQAGHILHTSNYYQSDVAQEFAAKLVAAAGMKNVFLCNSGAEANEGAIKIARKYAHDTYGDERSVIVTLTGSFHGRTVTTLAATGQEKFHTHFGPFTPGFVHTPPGDSAALEAALDEKTVCALIMEPIQGESGVRPLDADFVKKAAALCAERDILLMFDEVQSGAARTGTFLAEDFYGVKGDVVTLAKGLSGGVPSGAILAGEKTAAVLAVGDHGSTFGGNALAAAAGCVVLDTVTQPEFLAEIKRKGEKIRAALEGWKLPAIKEVRGRGLMLAVDLERDAWPVVEKLAQMSPCEADPVGAVAAQLPVASQLPPQGDGTGLLVLTAGQKTLRFLPPYIISDDEIDAGLALLKGVLEGNHA